MCQYVYHGKRETPPYLWEKIYKKTYYFFYKTWHSNEISLEKNYEG